MNNDRISVALRAEKKRRRANIFKAVLFIMWTLVSTLGSLFIVGAFVAWCVKRLVP